MKRIRDIIRFISAIILSFLYYPHIIVAFTNWEGGVKNDVRRIGTDSLKLPNFLALLYLLHNDRYFRSLFYYRIGPVWTLLIGWWRPGDRYFIISKTTKIGPGVRISHPYSTIINAEYIGINFSCIHCTTIGAKPDGRPTIGDNVSLGANVTIIGNIRIGNNVSIGAGAVVTKDIPDNAVAVGNPAKVIKYKTDID